MARQRARAAGRPEAVTPVYDLGLAALREAAEELLASAPEGHKSDDAEAWAADCRKAFGTTHLKARAGITDRTTAHFVAQVAGAQADNGQTGIAKTKEALAALVAALSS